MKSMPKKCGEEQAESAMPSAKKEALDSDVVKTTQFSEKMEYVRRDLSEIKTRTEEVNDRAGCILFLVVVMLILAIVLLIKVFIFSRLSWLL